MLHFLLKRSITLMGAGMGGGPSTPPPPVVTQYPGVLAPPQLGDLNTISSFSYAQMVDLISDGPIEGIVNKDGKKVYDENLFEGIYLNDTPVKETSLVKKESVDISFLKRALKIFWQQNSILQPSSTNDVSGISKILKTPQEIDNQYFDPNITITSYHPDDSIYAFLREKNANFDSQSLIQRAFDLSPVIDEHPFLTVIKIPSFKIYLSKDRFDSSEGANGNSPLKMGMTNISDYIYFSIGYDNLTSFNYFEMPRSYIENNVATISNKKTFNKTLIDSTDYFVYQVNDLTIYIWSIYHNIDGIKNIDTILDRYFNNIYVFQNDASLFNYNLIQSEFKNGSEIQPPLSNFNNIQIDVDYQKELVGPYKLSNAFSPKSALDAGGVQRLCQFASTPGGYPVANIALENETSDDIRYIKNWPVEYNSKGDPYLICEGLTNYAQFDKTSSSRVDQACVPVTHYIANENVEEVYVTVNLNSLYDTNHTDLVCANAGIDSTKAATSDDPPLYTKTYGELPGTTNVVTNTTCTGYLLIWSPNNDAKNGYVIDGCNDSSKLFTSIDCIVNKKCLYYKAISLDGFGGKYIGNITDLFAYNLYNIDNYSILCQYMVPNDICLLNPSFKISNYDTAQKLQSKLSLLNDDGSPVYSFGTTCTQSICNIHYDLTTTLYRLPRGFYKLPYSYYAVSDSNTSLKAIVATSINSYIDWGSIFCLPNYGDDYKYAIRGYTIAIPQYLSNVTIDPKVYPNIKKYLIDPLLIVSELAIKQGTSTVQTVYAPFSIKNPFPTLHLIGFNNSYLRSKSELWQVYDTNHKFLKLSVLENLLELYVLKTKEGIINIPAYDIKDTNISKTSAFQEILQKFDNGKLIGSSSVYSIKSNSVNGITYISKNDETPKNFNVFTSADKTSYLTSNIYLYNLSYPFINNTGPSSEWDSNYDIVFYYELFSNVRASSALPLLSQGKMDPALAKATQSITAGTRLPSIINVKVETGYESKEQENYIAPGEYFQYRYEIFGLSTDQALIDLGRKNYSFVKGTKLSSDRGGYLSTTQNKYYYCNNFYLYKITYNDASSNYFYYISQNGEFDTFLNSYVQIYVDNDQQLYGGASWIFDENSNKIGIKKSTSSSDLLKALDNAKQKFETKRIICNNNSGAFPFITSINDSGKDLYTQFFNCDGCVLDLIYLNCFNKNFYNCGVLPSWITPVESYINSFSNFISSCCAKDIYCLYNNANNNNYLKIEKYNFKYTTYQTLTNSSTAIAEIFNAKTYFVNFVFDFDYVYETGTSWLNPYSGYWDIAFVDPKLSSLGDIGYYFHVPIVFNLTHFNFYENKTFKINGILIFSQKDISQKLPRYFDYLQGYSLIQTEASIEFDNLESTISNINKKLDKNSQIDLFDLNNLWKKIKTQTLESKARYYTGFDNFSSVQDVFKGIANLGAVTTIDSRTVAQTNTINQLTIPSAKFWLIYNNTTKLTKVIYKMPSVVDNVVNYSDLGDSSLNSFNLACFVIGGSPYTYNIDNVNGIQNLNTNIEVCNRNNHGICVNLSSSLPSCTTYYAGAWREFYDSEKGFYQGTNYYSDGQAGRYQNLIWANVYSNNLCNDGNYAAFQFASFYSQSFTDHNILLRNLENYLQTSKITNIDKTIIPTDVHILDYNSPFKVGFGANLNYPFSSVLSVKYFELTLSNINQNQTNTFANDAGMTIQLPPPKVDQNGKQIRRYVKVSRMSHETLSPFIGKRIALQKVTEIIPQKFSYPFSSIVGTKIDARSFSQIPNRTFDCKLKKVLVPSNYFPLDEEERDIRYLYGFNYGTKYKIYDGDWDGTFKLAWTNNPAWILMDLLVNKRYGLGNYIESEQVDIWELYKIARWCDGVDDNGYYFGVPDSYGGVEPRHAFNALIKDKFNIYDMINQIASVFRGHVYYMNSLITFDDDRLKPAIGEFNNADVKDGLFSYTNHKKDDEFTAVDVAYIDARDNYKAKIEYIEDSDGIRKRGVLKKQINAFGITSRGQARRFGKHFLFQTSKENSNVSFTTDMKALLYKPGDLIIVNDELQSSIKNYGVVKDVSPIDTSSFKVVIDKILDSGIYNTGEITLYTPTAKPKYDDISSSTICVPSIVNLDLFPSTFDLVRATLDKKVCLFKNENFNAMSSSYGYTGQTELKGNFGISSLCANLYLNYINDFDINGNSSKYGHWELTTGSKTSTSGSRDLLYKFDVTGSGLLNKLDGEYQEYFFNLFDTAFRYDKTGTCVDGSFAYQKKDTSILITSFTNQFNVIIPARYKICASGFTSNKILFQDVVQNDYPSIESFTILNYSTGSYVLNSETVNEYTEVCVSRSGFNNVGILCRKKSVDDYLVQNVLVGSAYSLKIQNKENSLYKIMSITENYINEYNILATQYNRQKFKEIEENDSCDSLSNTFNFLTAYTETSNSNTAVLLKSPIINSIEYAKDINNVKYLIIKWTASQNATDYNIYIKTPSSQTRNYRISVSVNDSNYYNALNGTFQYPWLLPNEIGTYTITIEAFTPSVETSMYKFSPEVSRSISILEY